MKGSIKRSFTLIETLIASFLFILLTTTLMFWITNIGIQTKEDKFSANALELQLLDARLDRLFTHINEAFFFTDQGNLFFYYDNGIHKEPFLSSYVLAELSYAPDQQGIILSFWPPVYKGKEPSEHHIVCSHIEHLEFQFYSPLPPSGSRISELYPKPGWNTQWNIAYPELPTFIKVIVSHHHKTFELIYPLLGGEQLFRSL